MIARARGWSLLSLYRFTSLAMQTERQKNSLTMQQKRKQRVERSVSFEIPSNRYLEFGIFILLIFTYSSVNVERLERLSPRIGDHFLQACCH